VIERVKPCRNPVPTVFDGEDFGSEFISELREQEERLRQHIEREK
jgi:hypothetical protein